MVSAEAPWPGGPVPAGARVAGYRLGEQIGRGGMAVVCRAHDVGLDRQEALKILDPALRASLAVIDAAAALAGRPSFVGMIGARGPPREFAVEPGGRTALITNSASHQLEAANVAQLG